MGCLQSKSSTRPAETAAGQRTAENPNAASAAPVVSPSAISDQACFGAGCYWGTEKYFVNDFSRKHFPEAMVRGKVGFMGPPGSKADPSYKEVGQAHPAGLLRPC